MKAYGFLSIEKEPDIGDIKKFGLKSSLGSPKGRSGEHRSIYFNSSETKRNARRIWKKRYRQKMKSEYMKEINSEY